MPLDAATLAGELERLLNAPVTVIFTDNTASMISARKRNDCWTVRLHSMFSHAEGGVLEALSCYLCTHEAQSREVLRTFLSEHSRLIRKPRPQRRVRRQLPRTGRYHDLGPLLEEVNRQFFRGALSCRIGWSAWGKSGGKCSIRMGSYDARECLIRIHPSLDRQFVPRYVVKAVIFHEALHHVLPEQKKNGRRVIHSPEFRRLEAAYPDHLRVLEWQKKNLSRLLQ